MPQQQGETLRGAAADGEVAGRVTLDCGDGGRRALPQQLRHQARAVLAHGEVQRALQTTGVIITIWC